MKQNNREDESELWCKNCTKKIIVKVYFPSILFPNDICCQGRCPEYYDENRSRRSLFIKNY